MRRGGDGMIGSGSDLTVRICGKSAWRAPPAYRSGMAQRKPAPPKSPTPHEEEAAFVRSLERQGQIHAGKGPMAPGTTHTVEVTRAGAKRVRRRRFSAT